MSVPNLQLLERHARLDRRTALRLIGGSAVAVALAGGIKPQRADAAISWCRADPVLMIDDQVIDVWLASYDTMRDSATGPVEFTVTVPSSSSIRVLASDRGFGYGYDISVATSNRLKKTATSTPIRVEVYAPALDGALPIQINQVPRNGGNVRAGTTMGLANSWVVLNT